MRTSRIRIRFAALLVSVLFFGGSCEALSHGDIAIPGQREGGDGVETTNQEVEQDVTSSVESGDIWFIQEDGTLALVRPPQETLYRTTASAEVFDWSPAGNILYSAPLFEIAASKNQPVIDTGTSFQTGKRFGIYAQVIGQEPERLWVNQREVHAVYASSSPDVFAFSDDTGVYVYHNAAQTVQRIDDAPDAFQWSPSEPAIIVAHDDAVQYISFSTDGDKDAVELDGSGQMFLPRFQNAETITALVEEQEGDEQVLITEVNLVTGERNARGALPFTRNAITDIRVDNTGKYIAVMHDGTVSVVSLESTASELRLVAELSAEEMLGFADSVLYIAQTYDDRVENSVNVAAYSIEQGKEEVVLRKVLSPVIVMQHNKSL